MQDKIVILMKYYLFIFCFGILSISSVYSQADTSDFKGVAAVVFMDSFVVSAKRGGFKPEEFIQYVIEDESFYHAFQNIRFLSYKADNTIDFFNKKKKLKASYKSSTQQVFDGQCRTMEVLSESTSGNFYKGSKKQYRYYTAKIFDRVFFTHGKVCPEKKASNTHIPTKGSGKGKIEKHIYELKKLIFQPGKKANVPFIGSKTEIFSPKMQPFYNYLLISKELNGIDCYVFIAAAKPEFSKDKTIVKYMESYFEKDNFQILARNYKLEYNGALFSFDIKMKVKLSKKGDLYFPKSVEYDGAWDVPMKAAERCKFSMKIKN